MRILHLLASPVFSGPAENVALLAEEQRQLGCQVSVAVDRKREGLASEEPIVPRLTQRSLLDEPEQPLQLSVKSGPLEWSRDLRALRAREVDLIHAHFTHDHLLARWALAGRLGQVSLVRSIHAPRSLRRGLPFAHGYTVPAARYLPWLEDRRRRATVLSARVDPTFQRPSDRAALRRALELQGAPIIGMVSTFKPSRRHQVALESFARLRGANAAATLVLLGDGRCEAELRAQVQALGLGTAVIFAGYRQGQEFVHWLQSLDCIWVLGLGNDWSARAAAQARACGVQVIGVDEGALPEWSDRVVLASPDSICAAMHALPAPAVQSPGPKSSGATTDPGLLRFYASLAQAG